MNNNWNFAKKDLERLTILVLIFRFQTIRFKRLSSQRFLELVLVVAVATAAAAIAVLTRDKRYANCLERKRMNQDEGHCQMFATWKQTIYLLIVGNVRSLLINAPMTRHVYRHWSTSATVYI
jgi:hypothetical protein